MDALIGGVIITPLKIVPVEDGDILHAVKRSSPGFVDFGEAYFSTILPGRIKAWKKHLRMTLNLVVPEGCVRFVIFDDRPDSPSRGQIAEIRLSRSHYARLTVPPGLWMGFQCVGENAGLILNLADMEHDPSEAERLPIEGIPFDWNIK